MDKTPAGKLRPRRIAAIAVATLCAFVALIIIWRARTSAETDALHALHNTVTVQRSDLTVSVVQNGEILAAEYTDYLCEVEPVSSARSSSSSSSSFGSSRSRGGSGGSGEGVYISEIVDEGTYITEQDVANHKVLVQLDSSGLQEQYSEEQTQFAAEEADYTAAKEANDIQVNQNRSDITAAELAVKFALMDLTKYLSADLAQQVVTETEKSDKPYDEIIAGLVQQLANDPNDPRWAGAALQAKRVLEGDIKLAKGKLERDRNQLDGTKKLFAKQYVSASELESDQLNFDRSEIEVRQANTAMQLFLKYDFSRQSTELLSTYVEAERQLQRAKASARAKLTQAQAKLNMAEATYKLRQKRLARLKASIAACTIVARTPGMVIYATSTGFENHRREPIQVGGSVYQGQKIITVPGSTSMAAEVRVHESWVDKIKVGQSVKISVDSLPDKTFAGRVAYVSPLPDPMSRFTNSGLKVYTTKITLEGDQTGLRPGMTARIEIIVTKLPNVLCVPVQAVASRNGVRYCYVVSGSKLERRVIETGQFNDYFIEVTQGLKEGEVISLKPPPIEEGETWERPEK